MKSREAIAAEVNFKCGLAIGVAIGVGIGVLFMVWAIEFIGL